MAKADRKAVAQKLHEEDLKRVRIWAARSAKAQAKNQGLPELIEDVVFLERLAADVAAVQRAQSKAAQSERASRRERSR